MTDSEVVVIYRDFLPLLDNIVHSWLPNFETMILPLASWYPHQVGPIRMLSRNKGW